MYKMIKKVLKKFCKICQKSSINRAVDYSVAKYGKTYKMLEKNEKITDSNSSSLVNDGVIRNYFR